VTAAGEHRGWHGHLALHYRREGARTTALDRHHGPLRVLQRLYPEGPGICHHVLVHPPGGLVGGDRLEIDVLLDAGSHGVITTPSATRFYRTDGAPAAQHARLHLAEGARLEWLPLETIAFRGCLASNRLSMTLAPGAEAMGWDVLALGLPASGLPFDHGRFEQHLELPGVWLERGRIDAADTALLDGPVGLAGHRVLATLWFAAGQALPGPRREALLDGAVAEINTDALAATAGVTSAHAGVVVLRVLAHRVEPAMALLARVRAAWRRLAWALDAQPPRIWRM
jgi:urease accessory protein